MDARLRVVAIVFSLFAGASALIAQQEPPPLVTALEIVDGLPADGSRWLTFGGDYGNQRHSPLTQITPENVESLVSVRLLRHLQAVLAVWDEQAPLLRHFVDRHDRRVPDGDGKQAHFLDPFR